MTTPTPEPTPAARELAVAFTTLAAEIHANAIAKGFWSDRGDEAALLLMHTEISEACEVLRDDPDVASSKIPGHPALAEELADVVIRVMDFAARKELDVGAAIAEKTAFNTTRPHKHGKRF